MRIGQLYQAIRILAEDIGMDRVIDYLEVLRTGYCCYEPYEILDILDEEYDKEKLLEDAIGCTILDSIVECLKTERYWKEICTVDKVYREVRRIYEYLKTIYDEDYLVKKFNEVTMEIYSRLKRWTGYDILSRKAREIS